MMIRPMILQIFENMTIKLTPRIFYGNLYSIMLKYSKLRTSGMKFLSKVIPNDDFFIKMMKIMKDN